MKLNTVVCGRVHIIFTAVPGDVSPRAGFPAGAASCHSNHPRPEPPGTSLIKGRSCRAERLKSPASLLQG